jgi:hypothetical protein
LVKSEIVQKDDFLVASTRKAERVHCRILQAAKEFFKGTEQEAFAAIASANEKNIAILPPSVLQQIHHRSKKVTLFYSIIFQR